MKKFCEDVGTEWIGEVTRTTIHYFFETIGKYWNISYIDATWAGELELRYEIKFFMTDTEGKRRRTTLAIDEKNGFSLYNIVDYKNLDFSSEELLIDTVKSVFNETIPSSWWA